MVYLVLELVSPGLLRRSSSKNVILVVINSCNSERAQMMMLGTNSIRSKVAFHSAERGSHQLQSPRVHSTKMLFYVSILLVYSSD